MDTTEQNESIIETMLDRLLSEQCDKALVDAAEAGTWPADLWRTLAETGVPLACAPERLGGSALPLAEGLALLKLAGRHALPLPLAETLIAAAILGTHDGIEALPAGPLTIALGAIEAQADGAGVTLSGFADDVPWGAQAEALLCAFDTPDGARLAFVPASAVRCEGGRNMAGDPRDRVSFDAVAVAPEACFEHPAIRSTEDLRMLLALSRALMMAGAMQDILTKACGYALERKQFGRPVAGFQAVQQQLAVLAGDAAAALRAADGALEQLTSPAADFEIAVAKARVGEAAGRGAEIAHQVHGAMGFTFEHPLHQRTRRLWAWRDEYGAEHLWQARLGREICAAGADELWATLTHTTL